jgi:hypothetical protein
MELPGEVEAKFSSEPESERLRQTLLATPEGTRLINPVPDSDGFVVVNYKLPALVHYDRKRSKDQAHLKECNEATVAYDAKVAESIAALRTVQGIEIHEQADGAIIRGTAGKVVEALKLPQIDTAFFFDRVPGRDKRVEDPKADLLFDAIVEQFDEARKLRESPPPPVPVIRVIPIRRGTVPKSPTGPSSDGSANAR